MNPDPVVPQPTESLPDGLVRIVSALVNSKESPEKEWVLLLNTSDRLISMEGWHLADKQKARMPLSSTLDPGVTLRVDIKPRVALPNKGYIITLLNQNGLKVHGVSYTKQHAKQHESAWLDNCFLGKLLCGLSNNLVI
ncbi:lamin tail domain-containing protein [Nitrosospira sp. Nsp18]|uniref:lamin tail domain-containing protein n=1 Tax=Nitrosospira sp. Nsp18 TaxID=1855334 RepID=UPI00115FA7BE|nr:lamin tail domain-containing protein [Nitrosospira sp. Nsp18]